MIIANIQGTNLMVLHQNIRNISQDEDSLEIHSNMLRAQKKNKICTITIIDQARILS